MIQHVALEIRPEQIQDCADFYRLLGFEEVEPPESIADRAAWMERDGTQIHLLKTDEPTVLPSGHLAVVAPDYEATMSALEQAGHGPDHRSRHWGAPRAFVQDPAGNRVEVMAWPPS
ncbi:MAG TPA: VOC family protein [Thermoleophilaceae bacterium]|nr:VOC family protein [Thermoleophilaceae bacterium]